MGGAAPTVTIPCLSVSRADGEAIRAMAAAAAAASAPAPEPVFPTDVRQGEAQVQQDDTEGEEMREKARMRQEQMTTRGMLWKGCIGLSPLK